MLPALSASALASTASLATACCLQGNMQAHTWLPAPIAATKTYTAATTRPPLCLQVDMEERFCSKVKELGCTCVTISHRPALVAFHDLVLALDGEGGWSIHRGARAQSEGGQPELLDSGGSGPAGDPFP